ncbi:DUF4838 domain-containing protein [Jiangella gansuensis]|uniref:DUF4838 domain-containing protein n=1 Tax=Jiangella gansuensis TaxID=281473 RepID=UPI001B7F7ABA|nr:DUF4838 domain-containing protein [Jiangella gansuensis]
MVVHSGASAEVQEAAAELVSYVEKSTGVTLPAVRYPDEPVPEGMVKIYVGFTAPGAHPLGRRLPERIRHDGFCILPADDSITILGSSDSPDLGTRNGVRAFLARYLDVAWLMPTEVGDDVPERDSVVVSLRPVHDEPAFAQRVFSPLSRDDGPYTEQYLWARRNGLQASVGDGRPDYFIAFHHNLYSLFPVDEFGETHPEFYPNGKPPPPGSHAGWQPVFSEPGTIPVAVEKIKQHFRDNPASASFSLGVNDSGGFAEVDPVEPYYSWVNEVVTQVTAEFPDKWFGLLAYVQLEEPPPFALHPRVVPFFTQDRLVWADATAKADAQAKLDVWAGITSQLGFYDYLYGCPYVVPRVTPHLGQEVYTYAKEIGVIAHYAELYPNWGEGPKPWLRAKLLWNPAQDVDALLDEWCIRAVGAEAAPHLREYYANWESFWTERAVATAWFNPSATFQAFGDASYLEAVTDADIAESRRLIDEVVTRAVTAPQRTRAEKLARAHEYYDLSARTYPRAVPAPADSAAAVTLLETIEDTWEERQQLAERRLDLIDEYDSDPVLAHVWKPSAVGLLWGGWNKSEFWGLADYLRDHEPSGGAATSWLEARAGSEGASQFTQFAQLLLGLRAGTLSTLTQNWSFEDGLGQPPGWSLWIARLGANARFSAQAGVAHTGTASVNARAIGRGGPNQVIQVVPGLLATRAHVLAPSGTEWRGTVGVTMNLRDEAGTQIGQFRGPIMPVAPRAGAWFTVDSIDVVPEDIDGRAVKAVQYVLVIDGFQDDPGFLYIDDIVAYQAPAF